jgi:hypothetical protein
MRRLIPLPAMESRGRAAASPFGRDADARRIDAKASRSESPPTLCLSSGKVMANLSQILYNGFSERF